MSEPTTSGARHRLPEFLCDDCSEGDHEACRREGGWMHQDTNERCSCHLTAHALDPRRPSPTHCCPPVGSGIMPCCQRTPFEVPRYHRMTLDPKLVTCGK